MFPLLLTGIQSRSAHRETTWRFLTRCIPSKNVFIQKTVVQFPITRGVEGVDFTATIIKWDARLQTTTNYIKEMPTTHRNDKTGSVDRLLVSSTILKTRASDGNSANEPIYPTDNEQGTEHTSKTLTGQKTSGDPEHVHVDG